MELYYARYEDYFYSEFSQRWMHGREKSIIVVANTISEAKTKVEKCLSKLKGKNNAVLIDIVKCVGLNAYEGFEDSFYLDPIIDESEMGGDAE